MTSKNMGEQEGKPDFTLIFDDFPNCWSNYPYIYAVISDDFESLFEIALSKITIEQLQKAREYGCRKYAKNNWRESIGTTDHDNFMSANRRSIYRHLVAIIGGEEIDHESGCYHWSMVALRCMIALEYTLAKEQAETTLVEVLFDAKEQPDSKPYATIKWTKNGPQPKTRYDWSKVPEGYDWVATDPEGNVFAYRHRPRICTERMLFIIYGEGSHTYLYSTVDCPDWQDSLERRPE